MVPFGWAHGTAATRPPHPENTSQQTHSRKKHRGSVGAFSRTQHTSPWYRIRVARLQSSSRCTSVHKYISSTYIHTHGHLHPYVHVYIHMVQWLCVYLVVSSLEHAVDVSLPVHTHHTLLTRLWTKYPQNRICQICEILHFPKERTNERTKA